MEPQRLWSHAPKMDEPWGLIYLCGLCGKEPGALLVEGGGIVCGEHLQMRTDEAIPLEAAAQEAWPDLTREMHFNRVGTALVVLHALAVGAWYFSREGLTWAWVLWEAAVRIRGREGKR